MAKVFKHVVLGGTLDVSEYCTRIRFEDCSEEDDLIEVDLEELPMWIFDEPEWVKDGEIQVQWGSTDTGLSPKHFGVINDFEPQFGTVITCTIKALDKGHQMKKGDKDQQFKEISTDKIAKEIADRNGLNLVMKSDRPFKVWDLYPMAGKNDFDFLKEVVSRDMGDDHIVYVKGNELRVKQRGIDSDPVRKLTYGVSDITNISPKTTGSDEDGSSTETTVVGYDHLEKKPIEQKSNAQNDKTTKTGGKVHYDQNSKQISASKKKRSSNIPVKVEGDFPATGNLVERNEENFDPGSITNIGKRLIVPVESKEEAEKLASNTRLNSQLNDLEITISIPGDWKYEADTVITVDGLPARYNGNFYLTKVTHEVSGSYTTELEGKANGTSKGLTEQTDPAQKVNKKIGSPESKKEKKVFAYDENSNPL